MVNASSNAWQTWWPPLVRFVGILMLRGGLVLGPVTSTYYILFQNEISNIPTFNPSIFNQTRRITRHNVSVTRHKSVMKNGHDWSPASSRYMTIMFGNLFLTPRSIEKLFMKTSKRRIKTIEQQYIYLTLSQNQTSSLQLKQKLYWEYHLLYGFNIKLDTFPVFIKKAACVKAILAPTWRQNMKVGLKVFHCMISLDQYF